jgi:thiol-disulfide isomerase/thioredoxin
MKRFSLLLVLAASVGMLISCTKQEKDNTVIVQGKIENPLEDHVIFTVSGLLEPFLSDTALLDETGQFKTSFELDQCRPVTFKGGTETTQMYLCPGDSISMSLDTEAFDETLKYEGAGADKNNFLAEYYLKFDDGDNPEIPDFYQLRDSTPEAFLSLLEAQNASAGEFLDAAAREQKLPKEFISYMNTRIYFDRVSTIQMLSVRSAKDTTQASKDLDRKIRETVINAAEFKDPDALAMEYQAWLRYYLMRNIYGEISDSIPDFDEKVYDSLYYKRLEEILSPFEIQYVVYNSGIGHARGYNKSSFDKLMPKVEKYVTDTTWKNSLLAAYDEMIFKLNQPLPEDAFLVNLDDEEWLDLTFDQILAKYKGNVIYLDFWASWCGPCKAEMPNSKVLANKLKDEDVTFLYVSVDRDAQAWEDMIRIMQLHGLHYRLGKNTSKPVSEKYDVRYIPHYVLFDKKGDMVKNNMTRPGDPETEKMIRELL